MKLFLVAFFLFAARHFVCVYTPSLQFEHVSVCVHIQVLVEIVVLL